MVIIFPPNPAVGFAWTTQRTVHSISNGGAGRIRWCNHPSLPPSQYCSRNTIPLSAKRNKKQTSKQDQEDLDRWYQEVDKDASPDSVFWEEMERQRLLSEVGSSPGMVSSSDKKQQQSQLSPSSTRLAATTAAPTSGSIRGISSRQSLSKTNSGLAMAAMNGQTQKSVEATLSEYSHFACPDNWLNEELVWMMQSEKDSMYEEDVKSLDDQLDEWERQEDGDDDYDEDDDDAWLSSDDPWDHWGKTEEEYQADFFRAKSSSDRAADYLLDAVGDEDDRRKEEEALLKRLATIKISSNRLERARRNEKAAAFFRREPDEKEGFDRMWVSAIDHACFRNLIGVFQNYGVQFADNFGDWEDVSIDDGLHTIEDVASFKARQVYEVTGLPCIASRTSFEIEPVPSLNTGSGMDSRSMATSLNPRVASGYKFNDVGMHVEYICDALRHISEPSRVTRFTSCLCFYDGEIELYSYGVLDCDLVFSNSLRTFIPMSKAINEMLKTLELTFGLEFQKWITKRMDEMTSGLGVASTKLRDRVLKDGRVLPNDIIDVSAFMDSQVDVNLMDECAKELSVLFTDKKPTKILTVATTGLVIALPLAKYLQVPVVYARKERNVVMANTYKAGFVSKTVGKNRELLVSKSHLHRDDRVLIVDDFLSSGASQEALLRIISDSGAQAVGIGVLLEKVYDSGRQSLSGFDVPIHSLCRVASVKEGMIQLVEEDGFDRMVKNA